MPRIDPDEMGRIVEVIVQRGYVSIPKAAIILDCHPQTLRTYIKNGWIRTFPRGKRQVIAWAEVERYKREGNYNPDTDPEAQYE